MIVNSGTGLSMDALPILQGDKAAEEEMTARFKELFKPYDIMS